MKKRFTHAVALVMMLLVSVGCAPKYAENTARPVQEKAQEKKFVVQSVMHDVIEGSDGALYRMFFMIMQWNQDSRKLYIFHITEPNMKLPDGADFFELPTRAVCLDREKHISHPLLSFIKALDVASNARLIPLYKDADCPPEMITYLEIFPKGT